MLLALFEERGWKVDYTLIKSNVISFPYNTIFDWVRTNFSIQDIYKIDAMKIEFVYRLMKMKIFAYSLSTLTLIMESV